MTRAFVKLILIAGVAIPRAAHGDLASRKNAVVEVVHKVSPAVVFIGTEQRVEQRFRNTDRFFDFFDESFRGRQRQVTESLGSGVIIDPNGTIVTNDHVIRGASAIHVILADGRQFEAEVIGSDADNDLAVLKIQSKLPLPFGKLAATGEILIGETAIAIGSPLGLAKTVTVGVISAVGRNFKANGRVYNDFVQTDASINPGNSGGPLLNIDGEIIGINTAIFAGAQGIGFAIPSEKVKRIVSELTHFGKVRPGWVGIEVQRLTPKVASPLGWDRNYGVIVSAVEPSSPAEKGGIKRGDIITEVGGTRVADNEDFDVRMRGYPARTPIPFGLYRDGKSVSVSITAIEFPAKLAESLAWDRLGLRLKPGEGGLVISAVRRGSQAAEIGLESGDVIIRLNNQPMNTIELFHETLISARASKSVLLLLRRGRSRYYITLPF